MLSLGALRFILGHPLLRGQRGRAIRRWVRWQLASRLMPFPVAAPFIAGSRLLICRGMTGATGNLYAGLHDFQEMAFLLHLLRPADLFVDAGANVGTYTVLAAAAVGCSAIAVEPVERTRRQLMENLWLNHVADRVTVAGCALGAHRGVVRVATSYGAMNRVLSDGEAGDTDTVEVEACTLDDLLDQREPRLIKIDVEGFEAQVIAGAAGALAKPTLKAVIMEMIGAGRRYGTDEQQTHHQMVMLGFEPCAYLPFERKLVRLGDTTTHGGNVLYVNDFNGVSETLRGAPRYRIPLLDLEL